MFLLKKHPHFLDFIKLLIFMLVSVHAVIIIYV